MNDWREGAPNPVPHLLVIEAIREFESHFQDFPEKASLVETELNRLGRKPGFSATAQLLRSANDPGDSLKEISEFLAGRLSRALFDASATGSIVKDMVQIRYGDRLPGLFTALASAQGEVSEEQKPWFNGFAHFMIGLFAGSLLHFGYRLIGPASYEFTAAGLAFTFRVEKLDAVWEFGGNYH
jgi:hypothetical protein